MGIPELQEAIMNLRIEFDTRMTSLEEESGRHTIMLQDSSGCNSRMMIRSLEFRLCFYFIIYIFSLKLLLVWLGSAWNLFMFDNCWDIFDMF